MRAHQFKPKETERQRLQREDNEMRRAKLCSYYEDTYRAWSGSTTRVRYDNGWFNIKHKNGTAALSGRLRLGTLLSRLAYMEQELDMREHTSNIQAGMELGTGEDGNPAG